MSRLATKKALLACFEEGRHGGLGAVVAEIPPGYR
jgi:hypothetical protein